MKTNISSILFLLGTLGLIFADAARLKLTPTIASTLSTSNPLMTTGSLGTAATVAGSGGLSLSNLTAATPLANFTNCTNTTLNATLNATVNVTVKANITVNSTVNATVNVTVKNTTVNVTVNVTIPGVGVTPNITVALPNVTANITLNITANHTN